MTAPVNACVIVSIGLSCYHTVLLMAESLKKLWQGWKKCAHKLGVIQTYIIVTLFYWLIVPFFSLIRFQNLLRLRQPADQSYWIERKSTDNSLERAKRQS